MSDFIKVFEERNKAHFLKYKKYIEENDWTIPDKTSTPIKYVTIKDVKVKGGADYEGKEGEYDIQHKIVKSIIGRLKYFIKGTEGEPKSNRNVRRLIDTMMNIVNIHLNRVDFYISTDDIFEDKETSIEGSKKTERDFRSDEIEFDNKLYQDQSKISDELRLLNLDEENDNTILELYRGDKAPLLMREIIEEEYPIVKEAMERLKIDFESPPKNEMLYLMDPDKIPKWNPNKHYFEQDRKTLQFYVDELKKARRGVIIDGLYIPPWLYTHLNIFTTNIPNEVENPITGEKESKDILSLPPLRDNEWFMIVDNYYEAKKLNGAVFFCAARRLAKTTLLASLVFHTVLEGGLNLVVAGSNDKDLGQIEENFKITASKCNPAFRLPVITDDWSSRKAKIGLKKKSGRDLLLSTLHIINMAGGQQSSSEILAGFTPDLFVLDECMKMPFLDQYRAAKPAFETIYGYRLTPILSGTGSGNDALVKDAKMLLNNPEMEKVYPMPWEKLERGLTKEQVTWKRRKFGTFLPGQMSGQEGMMKVERTLPEYLGIEPTEELNKIKILVTDWENNTKIIEENRKALASDSKGLTKSKAYSPLDPEEIFLSGKENPFPMDEIQRWMRALEETGDVGKKVVLDYDNNGEVIYDFSNKEYAPMPFPGGFWDAPVTIYQDPLPNATHGFYIAGHDGYKQEQADSDSVGSFVIIRRDTGEVVASYHSRPSPQAFFHKQGLLLAKMYKAQVFMENADMGFKEYTDRMDSTQEYIAESVNLMGNFTVEGTSRRVYGWAPTPKNKSFFMGLFINMMTKQEIETDDTGEKKIARWGFQKIKDKRILQEMVEYQEDKNVDSIVAAMSAYAYDYYLTVNYGAPKPPLTNEEKLAREKRLEEMRSRPKRNRMYPGQVRRRMY